MNRTRSHLRRWLVAGTAAAGALTVATVGVAQAAPAPAEPPELLDVEDLPPSDAGWRAGEPADGLPESQPFCVDGLLPDDGDAWHRTFSTDLDTSAAQVVVDAGDAAAAAELATELREATAACAADWLRENPGSTAGWEDHGEIAAGDGAHSFAVFTAPPNSGLNVSLYGIGVEDSRVTLVHWGQMGELHDAPADAFEGTVRAALDKLAG